VAKAKERLFTSKAVLSWMDGDLILQDFYADWLYETKQYKQLTQPTYPFQIKGSLNYYQALVALPKHKFRAMKLLFAFLDELFSRNNVLVFLKERRLAQSMIPFYSGINKFFLFYFLIATKKYIIFAYLNEGAVANSPIMTFFKLKYLIQSNQKQTAAVTYQRFMHKYDGSQKKKIFNKIMILLMKLEYKKNKNEF